MIGLAQNAVQLQRKGCAFRVIPPGEGGGKERSADERMSRVIMHWFDE